MEDIFNIETDTEKESTLKTEITVKDIQGIELSLENLEYKGEGVTSFGSKYDEQKTEYLKTFGIEIEDLDHAQKVTTFIIFSHIGSLKFIEQRGGDLEKAVEIANRNLAETRIDRIGLREDLGGGITYEMIRKDAGFAANSEGRVSDKEYAMLLNRILTTLSRKNPSEMV